jgi:hypothetical protein
MQRHKLQTERWHQAGTASHPQLTVVTITWSLLVTWTLTMMVTTID